jgi:hypothetical protein
MRLVRLQQCVAACSLALAVAYDLGARAGRRHLLRSEHLANFLSVHTKICEAQLRDILAVRSSMLRHLELLELAGVVNVLMIVVLAGGRTTAAEVGYVPAKSARS